jgi:hypothetical protein
MERLGAKSWQRLLAVRGMQFRATPLMRACRHGCRVGVVQVLLRHSTRWVRCCQEGGKIRRPLLCEKGGGVGGGKGA